MGFTSKFDIKVELINKEEVKNFVRNHGEVACVCYNTPSKYAENVGKKVLDSGHFSGSRGDYFKFKVSVVPRACMDQVFRHESGTFKNGQSLRYVGKDKFSMMYPAEVMADPELLDLWINTQKQIQECYDKTVAKLESSLGYKGEKAYEIARGMLPMNINTEFVIGMDLEALINFMHKRLCSCSQSEIRYVAMEMRKLVLEVAPIYKPYLVAICDYLTWCPEDVNRCCGKHSVKKVEK